MRLIPLSGKYATGHFTHARVDDQDYAYLNQWRWKAKPNGAGTHIYAMRTEYVDGKSRNVWMHREVLGLGRDDPHDTDHEDHDTVNNTRANLRRVTRSENQRNRRMVLLSGECAKCGSDFHLFVSAGGERRLYCSDRCYLATQDHPFCTVYFQRCQNCQSSFVARDISHVYCKDVCRNKALRAATGDAAGKAYYQRNREAMRAKSAKRYEENKASILARQRARRARKAEASSSV